MALPTFTAGRRVRASELNAIVNGLRPLHAHKTADQPINSASPGGGTTLTNDTHLFVSVAANTTYRVFVALEAKEGASQVTDLKVAFTMPTLAVLDVVGRGPHTAWNASPGNLETEWAALQNQTTSPTGTFLWGTTTQAFSYEVNGLLRVGSNAGTFRLQWAQILANAANLTMLSGSTMDLFPVA